MDDKEKDENHELFGEVVRDMVERLQKGWNDDLGDMSLMAFLKSGRARFEPMPSPEEMPVPTLADIRRKVQMWRDAVYLPEGAKSTYEKGDESGKSPFPTIH